MKYKTFLMLLLALPVIMFSCTTYKDNPTPDTDPNYSQLKVGNYWVYQRFSVDSSGNATPQQVFDSCYISKDTIINNKTYFKINKPAHLGMNQNVFCRDSLHYTVTPGGKIVFSSQDFSNILFSSYDIGTANDTISINTIRMRDRNLPYTVPAGTFETINAYNSFVLKSKSRGDKEFPINCRYAANVGLVAETMVYYISQYSQDRAYIERRLVRYHVNGKTFPAQ